MKVLNFIIVEVEEAYNNEIELNSGVKLTVNTTIESVEHINRVAKVVSAPEFTILQEGDEVIIHHNICRLRNGVKGEKVYSNYHLEGNKYFVPLTEVFMYRRDSDWISIDPYCFVKPIKIEGQESSFIYIPDEFKEGHKGNERHVGILEYPNKQLIEEGYKKGDKIIFSKNSEYEFNIDGTIMYKMSSKDILAKIK